MIDQIYAAPKGGDLKAGIDFAIENRFGYELPTFYYPENLDNRDAEIAKYDELMKDFRGPLCMHGPIFDVNIASLDPEIEQVSRKRYLQAIDAAKRMGCRYLVFHSQWTPIYPAANCTKPWLAKVTDFWEQIVEEELAGTNLTVLIENFLDKTPETMNTLLSRINSPHLKACLDTGHVNIFSDMTPVEWYQEMGSQIVYIHAHNNNGVHDDHEAFSNGTIDLEAFLSHIALHPQRVNLAIETNDVGTMQASKEFLQPYLELQNQQFTAKSFLI